MTSFADSEKRLNAALSRIDKALDFRLARDAGNQPEGAGGDSTELAALQAENTTLTERLAKAEAELAEMRVKAATAEGQASAESQLQGELDALKAERAAETAALDEILEELATMIASAPQAEDAPFAEDVSPVPGEVVAFDKSEG